MSCINVLAERYTRLQDRDLKRIINDQRVLNWYHRMHIGRHYLEKRFGVAVSLEEFNRYLVFLIAMNFPAPMFRCRSVSSIFTSAFSVQPYVFHSIY